MITFEPHPISVLRPDERPCLLTDADEKAALIEATGVDDLVIVKFTSGLASKSADWFLKEVLLGKLGMRRLVIGYDFRFGKSREGDAAYLERAGERMDFGVDIVPPLLFMERPISSTRVRTAIARGEVDVAADMLGRPYSMSGTVVRGEGRGQLLEFPTANLKVADYMKMVPPDGVYAVSALYGDRRAAGALYIGVRPTYGGKARSIEVYVIDAPDGPEYGGALTIEFAERVRGEKTFGTDAALKSQIAEDVEKIRGIMGISP